MRTSLALFRSLLLEIDLTHTPLYSDISWTSFLGTKDGRKHSHSSWMYEVVFVLEMYGFLHRKMASERMSIMNAEEFNQKYIEIVKLLSQAAGVFQFISESVRSLI